MKMICMAVMLFITLLSAGAQKNIPASDIKVAMMKATRFMVEKVSNRGGYGITVLISPVVGGNWKLNQV